MSLPRPFARLLPGHEVRTISAVGWTGTRNGELLRLAAGSFDAFVTGGTDEDAHLSGRHTI